MMRIVVATACLAFSTLSSSAEPAGAADSRPMVNGYHLTPAPLPSKQLAEEISHKDAIFFDAFFSKYDLYTVGSLITDDFEFYHDKGRLTVSKEKFVGDFKVTCERQASGVDFRARRELVKDSLAVYPINNFGAVETGSHRFYMVQPGKPDTFTEESLFTIVWKKDGDAWKIARVLSYSHKLTD